MPPEKAVETTVLELIKSLQSKSYLKDFHLAGGTAFIVDEKGSGQGWQ
jgi:hypothetical protein